MEIIIFLSVMLVMAITTAIIYYKVYYLPHNPPALNTAVSKESLIKKDKDDLFSYKNLTKPFNEVIKEWLQMSDREKEIFFAKENFLVNGEERRKVKISNNLFLYWYFTYLDSSDHYAEGHYSLEFISPDNISTILTLTFNQHLKNRFSATLSSNKIEETKFTSEEQKFFISDFPFFDDFCQFSEVLKKINENRIENNKKLFETVKASVKEDYALTQKDEKIKKIEEMDFLPFEVKEQLKEMLTLSEMKKKTISL